MGRRYVPKTYNNRRVLRIILGAVITVALVIIISFVLLFFLLERFVVFTADGVRLDIPLLMD